MSGVPANFDFSFQPDSYWDVADPYRAILSGIKGEQRRRRARELLEAEHFEQLDELLTAESLPDEVRRALGQYHPLLMGGEYLPESLPGEVEIARVAFRSTTGDVISLRARPLADRIVYRVVDEYDHDYEFAPSYTEEPMTLGQLIEMIDEAENTADIVEVSGLVWAALEANFVLWGELEAEDDIECARRFVTVSSNFYPMLGEYYESAIERWIRDHQTPY